ncbi:MAG TPA: hypothetical protein DCW44_00525 [Eubacterium sp.]|nr:hypothetical protein [Eubacterium sp.]
MSFDNSKVIATKGYLIGAADAIRRKLGTSDTITLPNFESAIDSIPSGGLPDFELVCEYDFTSTTPKKDNARYNVEGNSNYISFDTTKGAVFDNANARFFNTLYNLNDGNSYKIEIEFGDVELNAQLTGKRNLFSYATNASKVDENSNSLGWEVSSSRFRYHTGAGDRYIDKPVNYWANDTLTIYYGLSVDSEGNLWLPSVSIDNSSSKSLIIMDKDLITKLTSPFQQDNPNFVLGGGANFYYMEVKKFRIYRINNLTNPPSLMMATPIGEQKSIDESIKEDEKSIEEEKADDIKEILDDENNFETKK